MTSLLHLPASTKLEIWDHLLSSDRHERAAFAFARPQEQRDGHTFQILDWYPVPAEAFREQTVLHIELDHDTQAHVIKRAHDLSAALVEFHSHLGPWPAAFSAIDGEGLSEFVPYVRWRLSSRPYVAMVVTRADFDGLVWSDESGRPRRLDGIVIDDSQVQSCTGLSEVDNGER